MSEQRAPRHGAAAARKPRKYTGWVPFLCVMAAIALLTTSAITFVTSPFWQRKQSPVTAQARNIGEIPTKAGAVAMVLAPSRIEIPRLKAVAPIVSVDVSADRELQIPEDPAVVGWWRGGAQPGARKGTAILAGHINYRGVTGVLASINQLNPGDLVYITGKHNGHLTRVKFKITGVRTYIKKSLPYQEIFDQSSVGRVAIVTCGGPFDASTGNYLDNIVAFAVPA